MASRFATVTVADGPNRWGSPEASFFFEIFGTGGCPEILHEKGFIELHVGHDSGFVIT